MTDQRRLAAILVADVVGYIPLIPSFGSARVGWPAARPHD